MWLYLYAAKEWLENETWDLKQAFKEAFSICCKTQNYEKSKYEKRAIRYKRQTFSNDSFRYVCGWWGPVAVALRS